jgi:hypothetical protein
MPTCATLLQQRNSRLCNPVGFKFFGYYRPAANTGAFAGSVKAVAMLERVKLLSSPFQQAHYTDAPMIFFDADQVALC